MANTTPAGTEKNLAATASPAPIHYAQQPSVDSTRPRIVPRPPKRQRVEGSRPKAHEDHAVQIARRAREDDALYRALLVRILKDQYIGVGDCAGNRREDGDGLGAVNLDAPVILGGTFTWSNYPVLERVLKEHMKEYFEMSWTCAQSKQQQRFNNHLVRLVYHTATINGYAFDSEIYAGGDVPLTQRSKKDDAKEDEDLTPLPNDFHWKKLRDRIRCFYKIHVQNSKKRLATILKNPHKARNRDALLRFYELVRTEPHLKLEEQENQQVESGVKSAVSQVENNPLPASGGTAIETETSLFPPEIIAPAVQMMQTLPELRHTATQTVNEPVSNNETVKATDYASRPVMKDASVQTDVKLTEI